MNKLQKFLFKFRRPPKRQITYIVSTYINDKLSKKFYSKSFVGNFLQYIYAQFANNNTINFPSSGSPWNDQKGMLRTNNTLVNVYSANFFPISAATSDDSYGILFGQGTTAPVPADYVIESLLPQGSGAGQLNYQTQTALKGCEIDAQITNFILQRIAVNNSGSQIDITEIVLYSKLFTNIFLLFRDVFNPADQVPNGASYRVTIEISITT